MASKTITPKSLSQYIYESDVYNYLGLKDSAEQKVDCAKKKEFIDLAFSMSKKSILGFNISKVVRNRKVCYTVNEFAQVLLSRHLAGNIRAVLKKSKSRNQISRQLVQHLREGTSYRIYRLDIKSFFETIELSTIRKALEVSSISDQTRVLIDSILSKSNARYQCGLPRGLEFSPPLAELILHDFDSVMKHHDDVFFYCRYVDDILIITNGFENSRAFLKDVKSSLPGELGLNYNKQLVLDVEKRSKGQNLAASFEYLGYKYSVRDTATKNNQAVFREVDVGLSRSRIKKIKTRVSRALYLYAKDGDFQLLNDRIVFLTSNRLMKDKKSKRIIATGVYYNNSNLTEGCDDLIELDIYLKKSVLGGSVSRGVTTCYSLTSIQKRSLLRHSFLSGYRNNNYKKFSPNRLGAIKDAWRY